MASDRYISKQKAARQLDVSEKTIDRLRAAGELDWIPVGRLVRISAASLEEFTNRRKARERPALESLDELFPIVELDALRAAKRTRRKAAEEAA
jgi:excisionase family DNA binding protein